MKWSSFHLNDEEMSFINSFKSKVKTISHYITSKPGIVTAANDFFIVNSDVKNKYHLDKYAKPIIQKSVYVGDRVNLNSEHVVNIQKSGYPSFLLDFGDEDKTLNSGAIEYLKLGEERDIHLRYKCRNRQPWFRIPIVPVSEAFIFKRVYKHPKIMKNSGDVYTTDAAYNISPKEGTCINSFIYSMYNPLTLCFFELYGRRYGGGVLELIPSEFKRLPLPYVEINPQEFDLYSDYFSNKKSIDDILAKYGYNILKGFVTKKEYGLLLGIYKKLVDRRVNMKSI
ncbi:putative DNA methylase [Buttiauxella brennerae ATCC 51605]|uniref:Putative DNA methylase n=1 Tax=Buttiauxella brennerae ATCC 51605 TaxID=1354251 RepID=A0A1B7IDU1_9ENTR|nr:putative DNA methylase [Buttiauxella brennerae ATCC 51605]